MAGALIIEDDPARTPDALKATRPAEKIMVLQTILYNTKGALDQISALFPSGDCTKTPDTWECSKRVVTVNGQIAPVITMRPGEVQRWRFIDSAFRQNFALRLEGHELHEIALDGLYLGWINTWKVGETIDLQPGYRDDVLVKAGAKGTYRLVSGVLNARQALRAVAEPEGSHRHS